MKILFLTLALCGSLSAAQRELQLENEFVRVWKTTIFPNEPLNFHRHDTHWVIVGLKGGVLKRIEDSGEISSITYETGKASWVYPDPVGVLHATVNEGDEPLEVMVIEMKNFNAPGLGHGIEFDLNGNP